MKWRITFFNDNVFNHVMALPRKIKTKLFTLTDRMEEIGPHLGMPYTRAMGDGLFEIRVKASEGIARVFYCVQVHHEIVLLHSFIKKTQETPKKELNTARKRMKEVRNNA